MEKQLRIKVKKETHSGMLAENIYRKTSVINLWNLFWLNSNPKRNKRNFFNQCSYLINNPLTKGDLKMKTFKVFVLPVFFLVLFSAGLFAQEHYTEGNVRIVSFYRTKPGQFDNYMKYLRANFLPVQEEAKKQGLIVGYSILLNTPSTEDDWDVAVVTLNKSFGDALDYSQSDDDKMKQIQEQHYKTADQEKMREMTSKRFDMRTYVGTKYLREISLKPLK